jgi:Zn-dependent protease
MSDNILQYVYLIPSILIAVTLHEFAHGYVSWKLGDPTPQTEGRLSLNPLRHLDPLGALCLLVFKVGWAKPVMINPYYYKKPKLGTVLVSLAGPAMNFVISILSMFAYGICMKIAVITTTDLYNINEAYIYIWSFFYYLAFLNIGLGVFNLIPIPPLDGSKVLGAILPERLYFGYMKYEKYCALILLVLLWTGVLSGVMSTIDSFIADGMEQIVLTLLGLV